MVICVAELQCREVINICTGHRLGYVCDIEFETEDGCVRSLIVPGPCRFWGLFGREDDFRLPWECIDRIGEDIILVSIPGDYQRCKWARRRGWW